MLHRNRMVNLLNGALNGNHVHTYAGTSRRHQLRGHFQRQIRHALKQCRYLRMLLQLVLIHHGKLSGAGHKHGQHVLFFTLGVFPVVLNDAFDGHAVEKLLQFWSRQTRGALQCREGHGHAHFHVLGNGGFFFGHHRCDTPVFRVIFGHFVAEAVGNFLNFTENAGVQRLIGSRAGFVRIWFAVGHHVFVFSNVIFFNVADGLASGIGHRQYIASRNLRIG